MYFLFGFLFVKLLICCKENCGELEECSPPTISHPSFLFSCHDLIEPYSTHRRAACAVAASVGPVSMGQLRR